MTHCATPPDVSASNLSPVAWDGGPVEFDTTIDYACDGSRKFSDDFYRVTVSATCLPGDVWEVPDPWPSCVESEEGSDVFIIYS